MLSTKVVSAKAARPSGPGSAGFQPTEPSAAGSRLGARPGRSRPRASCRGTDADSMTTPSLGPLDVPPLTLPSYPGGACANRLDCVRALTLEREDGDAEEPHRDAVEPERA